VYQLIKEEDKTKPKKREKKRRGKEDGIEHHLRNMLILSPPSSFSFLGFVLKNEVLIRASLLPTAVTACIKNTM